MPTVYFGMCLVQKQLFAMCMTTKQSKVNQSGLTKILMYGRLIFGSNQQHTSSSLGARYDLKAQLQVADATEKLLKNPQVAGVRDVKLRITTLRRRARVVYLPAYVVDYNFGSRYNAHGERTPERFQAVISGMGELLCSTVL